MAVSGTINVNLSALDTYTADGIDSEKKVVLSSSDNLPSAVVAVASGTCGTAAVSVDFSQFRGADGELVSFGSYDESTRIAFSASPSAEFEWILGLVRMTSRNNEVAVTSRPIVLENVGPMNVKTIVPSFPPSTGYTASYTIVMLKEA